MKAFGNIIWHFPFFGFVSAIFTYLLGLLLTATVVAAPVGLGLMELGKLLFWPFGNAMVSQSDVGSVSNSAWNAYSKIVMLIYLPIGVLLAVLGAIQVGFLYLSIIGIPAAMVVAKSLGTFLNPVGKKCVSSVMAEEIERRKARQELDGVLPEMAQASVVKEPIQNVTSEKLLETVHNLARKPKIVGYGATALGFIIAIVFVPKLIGGNSHKTETDNRVKKELTQEVFRDKRPQPPSVDTAAFEAKAAAERAAREKALADQAAAEKLASEKAKAEADAKSAAEEKQAADKLAAEKALAEKNAADKLAAEKAALAQQEEAKKKAAVTKAPVPIHATSPVAGTSKNQNNAIVDGMLKDGAECLAAKRFDCAITQAKSALRVDPNSLAAKSLLQKAKTGQQAAMDAIEIR